MKNGDKPAIPLVGSHGQPTIAQALGNGEALTNLYHKVNMLMLRLGAEGEIYNTADQVADVMSALVEIDGGTYDPDYAAQSQSESGWISVDESPKGMQPLLWYQPPVIRDKLRPERNLSARMVVENCKPCSRETTHWQYLPSPPVEGK